MNQVKDIHLALKKNIFKKSYYEFFKWSFEILHPGQTYVDTFHIKYLCDVLQAEHERILAGIPKEQDLTINIPPRTSKSLIVSVCFNAWVWITNPSATFICVSFDQQLTFFNSQLCRDLIKSEEYQELFGDCFTLREDVDAKGMYATDKGGYRISKTTGQNITGFSGLYIICDDPQGAITAQSEVERTKTNSYYDNALYNRSTPVDLGIRINVQQRLHEMDLSGHQLAMNKKGNFYKHINLPAEDGPTVNPPELRQYYKNGLLDPIRLSKKILMGFKMTLGTYGYAGQYEQNPVPESGGIFRKQWFEILSLEQAQRNPEVSPMHIILDPAYTAKEENDPTAILVCYVKDNKIFVVDAYEVWMEITDLIEHIKECVVKYRLSSNSKIYVEPKASGLSITQMLRNTTTLNVVETANPDKDKRARARAVAPTVESKRIVLLEGEYLDNFIKQVCAFPAAAHDDMVDTLVISINELLHDNSPAFFFI